MISGATTGAQQPTSSIQSFAKRQIEPAPAGQRMIAVFKRIYSMKSQPGWTAPYDDIAAFQANPPRTFISRETAEEKFRRQS